MILSIVGNSKTGKTTLIKDLVPFLHRRGLKVVVVKHTLHEMDIDPKGKDSWKLFQSGADVVLSSPHTLSIFKREEDDLDRICEQYLDDYDLIITEGFNRAGKDRIVVLNDLLELERFKAGKILAVISEIELEGYKNFKQEDIEDIGNFILERLKHGLQQEQQIKESAE